MNPRITERNLAPPLEWGRAAGMSWHHVIPYWLLRDVWNLLVEQHIATEHPEARVAIRGYLLLTDRSQAGLDSLIDRMRAENVTRKRASFHVLKPLEVPEVNQLATAAVWPSWNAVEGPNGDRRSDDPGDRAPDRFFGGLKPDEAVRMRTVDNLYAQFDRFVSGGPVPGPGRLRALSQAVATARTFLAGAHPIRFRPEMWVNEGGRWRKRRQGEPVS